MVGRKSIAVGAFFVLIASSASAQNTDLIRVLFPSFSGEQGIGENIATVLRLSLRKTSSSQGKDDVAFFEWERKQIDPATHRQAIVYATPSPSEYAQIVVWGRVEPYAEDVIANINITIPEYSDVPISLCGRPDMPPCDYRNEHLEVWKVEWEEHEIPVTFRRRFLSLSSIVLRRELVNEFRSNKGLVMFDQRTLQPIGLTGDEISFRAYIEVNGRDAALIESGGKVGVIFFPDLAEKAHEYRSFVGGMLQLFRGQWRAAERSFGLVLEVPSARVPTRIDALLYRGMARFRSGGDGLRDIQEAAKLAPYDRTVSEFLIVAYLAKGQVEAARNILKEQTYLFPEGDPWLSNVTAALSAN